MVRSARSEGGAPRPRDAAEASTAPSTGSAARDDLDALLDEIEEVLEEDAEEFVRGYIQKGGQ